MLKHQTVIALEFNRDIKLSSLIIDKLIELDYSSYTKTMTKNILIVSQKEIDSIICDIEVAFNNLVKELILGYSQLKYIITYINNDLKIDTEYGSICINNY